MLIAILSGFAGSLIAPFIHRARKGAAGWLMALLPLGLFIYFISLAGFIAAGQTFSAVYPWVPSLNITLAFSLDGLSLLFALLITGIGVLVLIYGGGYLAGHEYQGRFYMLLLMFMASMLGLVLADNLLTLFIFWELTSITSYLLIGFNNETPEARASALQALLVTGGGGLALLAGLLLLGAAGGSYQISEIIREGAVIQAHPYYLSALLLILLGAFTKSAQFPFHFWLPNAMAAPAPVSVYLHSATMVKAGVYLLARLHPALSGTGWWEGLVAGGGMLTMLIGAFLALNSTDLKRILAYSTISSLGTMVLLLGVENEYAVKAAIVFLLAHALYKGAMFMIAGAIDHETGTRDVARLGGLRKAMPILTGIAILAAVSLSGLGPVLSFIGKELLFEAVLAAQNRWYLFVPAAVITSAVTIAIAGIVTIQPFFGSRKETPHPPHDPPLSLWLGPAVLALVGLILGLIPQLAERYLAAPAVAAILREPQELHLALWHGFNPALLLSGIAIGLGLLAYWGWNHWRKGMRRVEKFLRWGPEAGYGWFLIILNWVATAQTRIIQNGYLRFYLLAIVLVVIGLAGSLLVFQGGFHWPEQVADVFFYEAALAVLIVVAALTAVRSVSRLGAIAALGVVGYSIALIYLLFGAPDLAMTQFLIESITVVLFVFAFFRLPRFDPLGPPGPRLVHAIIAILAGAVMTALVLSAVHVNLFPRISEYFMESAVSLAHGRNIVNVILVDFRGLDTLGEITVLAVAAVGVYAILRFRKKVD
jgi:multicomponent Na+:H+ antiporter subunit A